jgi:hypothetical protein
MKHIFDVEIAKEIGINAAIILENIAYWVAKNEANNVNCFDGHYWTYNSRKAYQKLFPYLSEKQINTAFKILLEGKYIIKGNFSTDQTNRTLWYALTDKGKALINCDISHYAERENALCQKGKCNSTKGSNAIVPKGVMHLTSGENVYNTDINTVINPVVNTLSAPDGASQGGNTEKNRRFIPPTVEEVKAYCESRHNGIDAEEFVAFYESKGWFIGRNKMKSWKAAITTWEKKRKQEGVKYNAAVENDHAPVKYDESGGYWDKNGDYWV